LLNHSACTIEVINKQEQTYGLTPLDKVYIRCAASQSKQHSYCGRNNIRLNDSNEDNLENIVKYQVLHAIQSKGGVRKSEIEDTSRKMR
jgi:hypothetical protein